jgi:putative ABC transport system ATP-binding protein
MKENNAILRLEHVGFQVDETVILNNINSSCGPENLS